LPGHHQQYQSYIHHLQLKRLQSHLTWIQVSLSNLMILTCSSFLIHQFVHPYICIKLSSNFWSIKNAAFGDQCCLRSLGDGSVFSLCWGR
jgi:hypothetical protein